VCIALFIENIQKTMPDLTNRQLDAKLRYKCASEDASHIFLLIINFFKKLFISPCSVTFDRSFVRLIKAEFEKGASQVV
jgi:hypothetical protein